VNGFKLADGNGGRLGLEIERLSGDHSTGGSGRSSKRGAREEDTIGRKRLCPRKDSESKSQKRISGKDGDRLAELLVT
jgi:hypothetical protein